jgi:OmpA family
MQAPAPPPAANLDRDQQQFSGLVNGLRNGNQTIVVEGYAQPSDGDKQSASLARANKVREQLLRSGVDANRVVAVGKGEQAGKNGGVRIVEAPVEQTPPKTIAAANAGAHDAGQGDPIGTSHFESGSTMSVPKGSAAMISIYKGDTPGEVVYLYDAESARGNNQYPFRAVRFKNPTDSQLEQGPVSVFGEGRFIGEGLTEPIPAKSTAFVPFALDRQIVVERKDGEKDEVSRIITVQRGVFSTEIKHAKHRTLTFYNRSSEAGVVYIRHTLTPGYSFTAATPKMAEKLGAAQLFRIEVPAQGKTEVKIEEATPVFRSTDLRTPVGLEMIKAYVSQAAVDGGLKAAVGELIKLNTEMANIEQRINLVREQQNEYRARMDELHVQIVTLKAVKTAGPMMASLEKKLQEMSDRVSKATLELVGLQEKLMVSRIKFQDGVSELTLEKQEPSKP